MRNKLKKGAAVTVAAIALVGAWEGLRTKAYHDITGVPTVCFGETRGVKMGDSYTVKECKAMLGGALKQFETGMRKCLKSPDTIPDGPYVAFLSLSYNVGTAGFCRSSARRYANAGDFKRACDAILLWNQAGGRVVQGLVNRREHERKVCLGGVVVAQKQPKRVVEESTIAEPRKRWWKRFIWWS